MTGLAALNNKKCIDVLYVHFKSAFDTVSHAKVLYISSNLLVSQIICYHGLLRFYQIVSRQWLYIILLLNLYQK